MLSPLFYAGKRTEKDCVHERCDGPVVGHADGLVAIVHGEDALNGYGQ